jgi:hypothetical protein
MNYELRISKGIHPLVENKGIHPLVENKGIHPLVENKGMNPLANLLLLLAAVLLLAGCGTIRESSTTRDDRQHTTDVRGASVRTDSVYVYRADSVYIRERGDSVIIDRWHTQIAYRDRLRTDTLRTIDSVRVEVVKEVERVREPSLWVKMERWISRSALIGVVLFIIYCLVKRVKL